MEKEIRQEGDYTITDGIHGDTYHHPSFGMLSFSRAHGGHSNLFGSSIQHRDTIHMVLKEGTVSRDLNEDWYLGGPEIVEVEMSQSQFAELITSMNMGSGVPCTIKFIKGKDVSLNPISLTSGNRSRMSSKNEWTTKRLLPIRFTKR